MSKIVKWKDIVNGSKAIKKHVETNQKEKNLPGLNKGETLYVLASAVKHPGKDVTISKNYKTCPSCTGNGVYENLSRAKYIDVANRALNWLNDKEHDYQAPNYITFGTNGKISVRLANFAFSKIIVYYDSHKRMPDTCWFANAVFNTKSSLSSTLVKKLENISKSSIKNYKDVYNVFVNFFYYDFYYEDKQTQSQTISRKKGNCVDLNQVMYHVLKEMGYDVRIVRGVVQCSDGQYGHVWCQIKINGNWVNIDASAAAKEKPLGSVICASVISITNINDAWMVNDTGDS
ncbi:transglutaminase domain-containing protein [Methanobrevibacter sp.]|uniref:transglutaminase domain-containing protein n=1 Tax=Methanobrevibacter sp. TaxID=66852 RepID=UPI00386DBB98